MLKILLILVVALLAWHVYDTQIAPPSREGLLAMDAPARAPTLPEAEYQCDGREHCSQMKSCAEAEFFLANCPGVKMDGDGDGLPCERGPC